MSTGAKPLMLWGAGLLGICLLGIVVFDLGWLPATLLGAAGAGGVLLGVLVGRAGRDGGANPGPVLAATAPASSGPTVLAVLGATSMLVGSVFGQAFLFPGLGMLVVGLVAIAGERRAMRRVIAGADPDAADVGKGG